jgi:ferredoxin
MQIVLWILLIAVLVIIVMNRASARRCDEDIDEIRSSLFDLRRQAKNRQAEMNRKLAELRVAILKNHGMIPEDRNPYYITSDCISCGTCVTECPVNAITDGDLFEIDPETCIACKKCADVCPVHACQPLLQQPEQS